MDEAMTPALAGFVLLAIGGMIARRRNSTVSAVLWIAAWLMFAWWFYEWFSHEPRLSGFLGR